MANAVMDTVLRGVLPDRSDRLLYAIERIEPEYFEQEYKYLWQIIRQTYHVTAEVLDSRALDKILPMSNFDLDTIAKIEDLWRHLSTLTDPSDVDFRVSIDLLVEDYKRNRLGEALTQGIEILTQGYDPGRGRPILRGPADAITEVRRELAEIEGKDSGGMQEFDMRTQKAAIMKEFNEGSHMERMPTGMTPLDAMTFGGIGLGEFWLSVAYTGVGKSMKCVNIGHHFAVTGKNVLYFTTETVASQIRQRLLVRHSHMEKFGVRHGLSSEALKRHTHENPTLSEEELEAWHNVVEDFTTNPEYGRFIIVQVPRGTRLSVIQAKMDKWQLDVPLDLVIIDSVDMLSPEVRRPNVREELNELLVATKHMAVSFNEGKGIRIISPWQTSREAWRKAVDTGRYDKSSLAETSEAERRADLIVSMLEHPDTPTKLKVQTLKFRDGTPADFELDVNYNTCYIGSDNSLAQAEEYTNLDSLI